NDWKETVILHLGDHDPSGLDMSRDIQARLRTFRSEVDVRRIAIVMDQIDAVEMTSWDNLYGGIDPYSISDWYRYLNCGYFVAAVGGTDKMCAATAVGTVRTYAQIDNRDFTYDSWKESVRSGKTFVTYGPLIEFSVEGHTMGARIELPKSGGTLNAQWKVATVTIPVSKVELIVNGETRDIISIKEGRREAQGNFSVKIDKSSWIALRVRGSYSDKQEMIAAHSSPVMVKLEEKDIFAAADAITILEQIEGAIAFIDTVATRAQVKTYKTVKMSLTSAHRSLQNRMHSAGTSVEEIGMMFDASMASSRVDGIVFDVDSPGGGVPGLPELADKVFNGRGVKPMATISNGLMASAALWLGSAADEVWSLRSSETGSLGVFHLHLDESKALEQDGVVVTEFSAGRFKTEGAPWGPLSEEAKEFLTARVDEAYGWFVSAMAQFKGVSPASVRSGFGEGRVLGADAALKANLIDKIGSFEQVVSRVAKLGSKPKGRRAAALRAEMALDNADGII
ncbi:hypothetical protein LCGC14_1464820, partial [marine sediment metagenome]